MVSNLCKLTVIRYQMKKNAYALNVVREECQRVLVAQREVADRRPVCPGSLFIITASERESARLLVGEQLPIFI